MQLEKKIIPAMIAKTQKELIGNLEKVLPFSDRIQLDIMDDIFVKNTSLFFDFSLPKQPCHYEAHLMVQDPKSWIDKHGEKVDTILVHIESDFNMDDIINSVKNKGKNFGLVLNPETSVDAVENVLDEIDQILIMTVNPGFYGSPFLPEMTEKIRKLYKMKPTLPIEVDGGITPQTIELVHNAGASLFVSGSYIIKANNPDQSINTLKELVS